MTKYDLKMQRRQEEEKKAKKGEGNHQNRLYSRSDRLCMYCCLEVLCNYQKSMAHILQLAIMKFRKLNLTIIITAA